MSVMVQEWSTIGYAADAVGRELPVSEVSMRNTMKRHYDARFPDGHWQRIEDGLQAGIPDINFVNPLSGFETWMEAKQLDEHKLPKRSSTPVRIGLRKEQRIWLDRRLRAGGRVLVVAKLGSEWFVFSDHFKALEEGRPLAELRYLASRHWSGPFDLDAVL